MKTHAPSLLGAVGVQIWIALLSAAALRGQPRFVRGDINLDGSLSFTDICYYLDARYLGGTPPRCEDAVDLNDNGVLDLQGDVDGLYLWNWLFRSGPEPRPPFPKRGPDPTTDPLGCADDLLSPPGNPQAGYEILLDRDLAVKPGETDMEMFVLVSTAAPIECFSIAYRVDRRFATNVRVDLEETIFPKAMRSSFISSGFLRVVITQSASPIHDLLLIGVAYILPAGQQGPQPAGGAPAYERILFDATTKALRRKPLLRILVDARPDAPAGGEAVVFAPAPADDYVLGEGALHGIRNELGGVREGITGSSIIPISVGDSVWVALDGGEYLRADANADYCVDISDAANTLNFLFLGGMAPGCPDAADANDDGRVDISDGIFTLQFLFSGGPDPPERREGLCGYDDTEDALGPCVPQCGLCFR